MRVIALLWVLLLTGCGTSVSSTTTATPTPTPTPSPDVGALYSDAIGKTHNYLASDYAAIAAAKPGSAEEATAARHLSEDFQALLDTLDRIPFPPNAQADLSALKKSLVALQIFWSGVASNANSYNSFSESTLTNAYSQAALVLGHDVGVSLVIAPAVSPTP